MLKYSSIRFTNACPRTCLALAHRGCSATCTNAAFTREGSFKYERQRDREKERKRERERERERSAGPSCPSAQTPVARLAGD